MYICRFSDMLLGYYYPSDTNPTPFIATIQQSENLNSMIVVMQVNQSIYKIQNIT